MHKQLTMWPHLPVLVMLTITGMCPFATAADEKQETPKPFPPEVVKTWRDAGVRDVGWMKDLPPQSEGGYEFWDPWCEKSVAGAVPAFKLRFGKGGELAKLPDPGVPFGLDFHCCSVKGPELKELAGLKNLHSLNIGASLVLTDEGLREVSALKNLRGLYIFYAPVTDGGLKSLAALTELRALDLSHTQVKGEGVKELAGLKNLQALNLSYTRVTDAGLKEIAGLKNLRWLSLHRTKVTAAGVAALKKDLPKCKIMFRED
jgi:internalin A